MQNPDPIKILHLEDSALDAEIIELEIKEGGLQFISKRVETEAEFINGILEFKPDIILSDYALPTFNGREALRIKNEMKPEIPLIIITGSNNESIAVDCMREGASDYILKGAITRLPFSILAAIRQRNNLFEKLKAEIEIQKSEIQYRALVEQMHEGLIRVDNDDKILFVNKNFCETLGYTTEELIGKTGNEILMAAKDREIVIEKNKQRQLGIAEQYEISMVKKSGESVYMLMNASPVRDNSGNIVGSMATCIDITKKKITENALIDSEEKFRKAFMTSPDAININRMEDGAYISINKGFTQITGYTEEDVIGKSSVDLNIWANSHDRETLVKGLKSKGFVDNIEMTVNCKNGEKRTGLMSAVIIYLNGVKNILSITRDITEKKKTENALRESEEIFNRFMEHSPVYVFFKDKDTRSLRLSRNYEKMLGKPMNELLYKTMDELFPSDLAKSMVADDMQILKEGKQIEIEEELNGRYYTTIKFPIYKDGIPTYLAGYTIDITEKKLADAKIREGERKMSTLMANLPGMSYRCKNDRNWTMEFVSEGCKELTGYDPSDFIENAKISFNDIIHPDDQEYLWSKWQDVLSRKEKVQDEYRIITAKGEIKWVWEQGQGVFDAKGNVIALEGFISDITERKKAETSLKENEEKLRMLLDLATDAFFQGDANGNFIRVNNKAIELTGFSKEELFKMNMRDLFPPDVLNERPLRYDLLIKGETIKTERKIGRKDGSTLIIEMFSKQMPDGTYQSFFRDITELKRYENELLKAKEKAEESDRLKSAFLANTSHEIRTPMNGILGFAELLKDPYLDDTKKNKYINIINNSSKQLLNIINDIIDISKIEAGFETINNEYFSLNDLFDELYAFFQPQAIQKNIEFELQKGLSDQDSMIESDPQKLKQSLINLIGNALKFTEAGHIFIRYSMIENTLSIEIEDTGIGMDEKFQKVVFERFRQVETTYTRKFGGTGLGLSISRSYIEMMGGTISVKSELEKGSCFTIQLPYKKAPVAVPTKRLEEASYKLPMIDLSKKTILVAEDEEINELYLRSALKPTGANLLFAKNGIEAINLFKKNPDISLILMDIKMPEMNGTDTTIAIKKIDKTVPVIAVTAYAFTEDREKCLLAGCNDYIQKPFRLKELYEIIRKNCK
jgi:PAS domain S-box-containing protein